MHAVSVDDQRIQRWLDVLRDGGEPSKIAARRGLARVFEQRRMLEEAIELLEHNLDAGVRSAETLRWLSRLYQARGDEYSSLEAAVSAPRHQSGWPESESPAAVEIQVEPTQSRMIRHLVPFLLVVVGLGIIVGAVLWVLSPVLKP